MPRCGPPASHATSSADSWWVKSPVEWKKTWSIWMLYGALWNKSLHWNILESSGSLKRTQHVRDSSGSTTPHPPNDSASLRDQTQWNHDSHGLWALLARALSALSSMFRNGTARGQRHGTSAKNQHGRLVEPPEPKDLPSAKQDLRAWTLVNPKGSIPDVPCTTYLRYPALDVLQCSQCWTLSSRHI